MFENVIINHYVKEMRLLEVRFLKSLIKRGLIILIAAMIGVTEVSAAEITLSGNQLSYEEQNDTETLSGNQLSYKEENGTETLSDNQVVLETEKISENQSVIEKKTLSGNQIVSKREKASVTQIQPEEKTLSGNQITPPEPVIIPGKVSLTVTSVNYKKLQIKWEKGANAQGYELYRATAANGNYSLLKNINSADTLAYQDSKITPNANYYYKIRTYRTEDGKKIYSDYSDPVKGTSYFTKVKEVKTSSSDYKTIKISWKKVSSAYNYQIYYSTSENSGYKRLKTVDGTSYTWKKVKCGTVYYFKVRATKKEKGKTIYGDFSTVASKKTKIGKPSSVSAKKVNYSKIKVSWKKVIGAQKYQVYYSTEKNGTYQLCKTTSKATCTHTVKTAGQTYYYKVRAVRDNGKSSYSKAASAKTTLNKLTGLKAKKYSERKIKVSWKKVDGAKQYKVYRSTSKKSGYRLVETITKNYYIDSDLVSGKLYYYKVMAVRDKAKTSKAGPVSARVKFIKQGIDVSEYQGDIQWKRVKNDGIDFAMLRIVKGRTDAMLTDVRFEEYYKEARRAGIDVGVYRYCYATSVSEAKKEAKKVLQVLNGRKLEYPIVLDMEDYSLLPPECSIDNATRSKMVLAFKKIIEDAGYEFALYANLNWVNNYLDMDQLEDVNLWLARWRDYERGPEYTGKGKLMMWQYSSEGRVDGINGRVDLDVRY